MKVKGMILVALALLAPEAAAQRYEVVPEDSRFEVQVGKAGLFRAFGHDHIIEITGYHGGVDWEPQAPESSVFELTIEAGSLTLADEDLTAGDREKIQADMENEALALTENPTIHFRSTSIEVDVRYDSSSRFGLKVKGTLTLRGQTGEVEVPMLIQLEDGGRLRAEGTFEIRGKDFGVPQISALGGSIKTKNELELSFDILAVSHPSPPR